MSEGPLVTEEALRFALTRASSFAQVNSDRPQSEKYEALQIWLGSVGLTPELMTVLSEWLIKEGIEEASGDITFGLIIGLFVSEYINE